MTGYSYKTSILGKLLPLGRGESLTWPRKGRPNEGIYSPERGCVYYYILLCYNRGHGQKVERDGCMTLSNSCKVCTSRKRTKWSERKVTSKVRLFQSQVNGTVKLWINSKSLVLRFNNYISSLKNALSLSILVIFTQLRDTFWIHS